jgi:uncharacterized RDD family membrane protein YckC
VPYRPAPFLRRLLARIIDLAFALLLTFVVAIPMSLVGVLVSPVLDPLLGRPGLITALAALCYFLAYVGLEVFLLVRRDGQTLGKGLTGLRVVPAAATPARLTAGAAATRMLLVFAPFVLGSAAGGNPGVVVLQTLAGLGFLSLLVSLALAAFGGARRPALHDLVARTRVVAAAKREISLRHDLPLALPGRISLAKQP